MRNLLLPSTMSVALLAVAAIAVSGCGHRQQASATPLTPAIAAQQRPGRTPPPPGMAQWYQNTMAAKAAAQGHS